MRALYQLRDDLADALGIPTIEAQDAPMRFLLNSFLIRAQALLYRQYKWDQLYQFWQVETAIGVNLYAAPGSTWKTWAASTIFIVKDILFDGANYQICNGTNISGATAPTWATALNGITVDGGVSWLCLGPTPPPSVDLRSIYGVWVVYNNAWLPVVEGIDPRAYTLVADMYPRCFARRAGSLLEFWPTPDNTYDMQIHGYQALGNFTADTDVTTLDDELVLLLGIAKAKMSKSFQSPDAPEAMQEFKSYLGDLRNANHGRKRYIPVDRPSPVLPIPIIVNPEVD